ncbi:MAG: hypothetical protein K2Q22_05145, partial [Cytophagales bacterium]|nr:hypothetical protein [Cytophagales bacterium]
MKYPQCFTGTLLDTVKSKQIRGSLILSNNGANGSKAINSIEGIQYFRSLDTLLIYSIPFENIALPANVNHLEIEIGVNSSQNIDSNFYPIALKSLVLYGNGITSSNNFSGDTLNYFPNR